MNSLSNNNHALPARIESELKKTVEFHINNSNEAHSAIDIVSEQEWLADSFFGSYSPPDTPPGSFHITTVGERSLSLCFKNIGHTAGVDYPGPQLEKINIITHNQTIHFHSRPVAGTYTYDIIDHRPVIRLKPGVRTLISGYDRVITKIKKNIVLPADFTDMIEAIYIQTNLQIRDTADSGHDRPPIFSVSSQRINLSNSEPALCYSFSLKEALNQLKTNWEKQAHHSSVSARLRKLKKIKPEELIKTAELRYSLSYKVLPAGITKDRQKAFDTYIKQITENFNNQSEAVAASYLFPSLNLDLDAVYAKYRHVPVILNLTQHDLKTERIRLPFNKFSYDDDTWAAARTLKAGTYNYLLQPSGEFGQSEQAWLYLWLCTLADGLLLDTFSEEKIREALIIFASRDRRIADHKTLKAELDDFWNKSEVTLNNNTAVSFPDLLLEKNYDHEQTSKNFARLDGDNAAFIGMYIDSLLTNKLSLGAADAIHDSKDVFRHCYYHLLGFIFLGVTMKNPAAAGNFLNIANVDRQSPLYHNLPQLLGLKNLKQTLTPFFSNSELPDKLQNIARLYKECGHKSKELFYCDSLHNHLQSRLTEEVYNFGVAAGRTFFNTTPELTGQNCRDIVGQLRLLSTKFKGREEFLRGSLAKIIGRIRQHRRFDGTAYKESLLTAFDLFMIPVQPPPGTADLTMQNLKTEAKLYENGINYYNVLHFSDCKFTLMHNDILLLSLLNFNKKDIGPYVMKIKLNFAAKTVPASSFEPLIVEFLDINETTIATTLADKAVTADYAQKIQFIDDNNDIQPSGFFDVSFKNPQAASGRLTRTAFIRIHIPDPLKSAIFFSAAASLYYNKTYEPLDKSLFVYGSALSQIATTKQELENKVVYYKALPLSFFDLSTKGAVLYIRIDNAGPLFAEEETAVFLNYFTPDRQFIGSDKLSARGVVDNNYYNFIRLDHVSEKNVGEAVLTAYRNQNSALNIEAISVSALFIGHMTPANYIANNPGDHTYTTALARHNTIMIRESLSASSVICRPGYINVMMHKYSSAVIEIAGNISPLYGQSTISLHCLDADTATFRCKVQADRPGNLLLSWRFKEVSAAQKTNYAAKPQDEFYSDSLQKAGESRIVLKDYLHQPEVGQKAAGWSLFNLTLMIDGSPYILETDEENVRLRKVISLAKESSPNYGRYNYITADSTTMLEPSPGGADILAGSGELSRFVNSRQGADVLMSAQARRSVFRLPYPGNVLIKSSSAINSFIFYEQSGIKTIELSPAENRHNTLQFKNSVSNSFSIDGNDLLFAKKLFHNNCVDDNNLTLPAHLCEFHLLLSVSLSQVNRQEPKKLFSVVNTTYETEALLSLQLVYTGNNELIIELYLNRNRQSQRLSYLLAPSEQQETFYLTLSFLRESQNTWSFPLKLFSGKNIRTESHQVSPHQLEKAVNFNFDRYFAEELRIKPGDRGLVKEFYQSFEPFTLNHNETERNMLTVSDFIEPWQIVRLKNALNLPQELQLQTQLFLNDAQPTLYELLLHLVNEKSDPEAEKFYKNIDTNEPAYQKDLQSFFTSAGPGIKPLRYFKNQ